jgi:hypothetical protein
MCLVAFFLLSFNYRYRPLVLPVFCPVLSGYLTANHEAVYRAETALQYFFELFIGHIFKLWHLFPPEKFHVLSLAGVRVPDLVVSIHHYAFRQGDKSSIMSCWF